MIRRIVVCSRSELAGLVMGEPHAIISITSRPPFDDHPAIPRARNRLDVLRMQFCDVEYHRIGEAWSWGMGPDDGDALATWLGVLDPEVTTLVVHCQAGASRSPSMAMAIADYLGLSYDEINWRGTPATGCRPPNRHVYDTTTKALSATPV